MNNEEIKNLINKYFDGELEKTQEPMLFFKISESEDLRNYFKEMNFLQNTVAESMEKFPAALETKIFEEIGNQKQSFQPFYLSPKRIYPVLSYILGIILIVISFFFYFESEKQKDHLEAASRELSRQSQLINLLYNSLPVAEVETRLENEIIIKANL